MINDRWSNKFNLPMHTMPQKSLNKDQLLFWHTGSWIGHLWLFYFFIVLLSEFCWGEVILTHINAEKEHLYLYIIYSFYETNITRS